MVLKYASNGFEYDNDEGLDGDKVSVLGETALCTAKYLIPTRVVNILNAYDGYHYDAIIILDIIKNAICDIDYSGSKVRYDKQSLHYLKLRDMVSEINSLFNANSKLEDPNHISRLYNDCHDHKSTQLKLLSTVSTSGKRMDNDGNEELTVESLSEIKVITLNCIEEAIKLVELKFIGSQDRHSVEYQNALQNYQYFHPQLATLNYFAPDVLDNPSASTSPRKSLRESGDEVVLAVLTNGSLQIE